MAEEIIFNTRVNTGNSVNELNKIDDAITEVDKSAKAIGTDVASKFEQLNKTIEKGGLSVRQYSKSVREYQSIALEAGRTSPIGVEALNRAAALQDELGDLRNEVSRLAHDGKNMQGALQVGAGITAGYGAMQGVMALVGNESEDLQKTMVKLTAITSVLNGIEQIRVALEKESAAVIFAKNVQTKIATVAQSVYTLAIGTTTGAMKALRVAMLAVPLFAIIAGVIALISALDSLMPKIKTVEELNDELTASYSRQSEVMERSQQAYKRDIDNKIKLAKSQNASADEMHKLELERLRREEKIRIQNIKASELLIEAKTHFYKRALEQENEEQAKKIKEEIQAERKKFKDLKGLQGQYSIDVQVANNERQNEIAEKEKADNQKSNDEYKKRLEKRRALQEENAKKQLELQRTIEDLAIANMEDEQLRAIAQLKLQQQREQVELISKYGANSELEKQLKTKQLNDLNDLETTFAQEELKKKTEAEKLLIEQENLSKKAELEGKLIQMRDDFEATQGLLREQAEMERTRLLENINLTEGEKFKIEEEYNSKIAELKQNEVDAETTKNEAIQASRQSLLTATASIFGQLAGLAQQGSKAQKAFALTEIGINTAVGFVQGLRIAQTAAIKSPTPVITFGIFYAQQLASVLGAAKQAKSILGAGGGIQAPSVPQTQNAGQGQQSQGNNTVTETQSNLTAGLQNNAQKVFVVDSEISMIQNNTRRAEAVSTIG